MLVNVLRRPPPIQYQIRFGQCLPWHVPKLSLSTVRYDANPRQMLLDLYTGGVHKIDWQKILSVFLVFLQLILVIKQKKKEEFVEDQVLTKSC